MDVNTVDQAYFINCKKVFQLDKSLSIKQFRNIILFEVAKSLNEEHDLIDKYPKMKKKLGRLFNEEYIIEKPNSHKSHELLHTHYYKRDKYPIDANVCGCDCKE
ncbi:MULTISPECIES: iron hydrogenase small subunit [unclassified Fusibacter]|uniref:iron hydrogenase small subunit n=1 Tax=unclassified Fusibacter TaxID=2624464 RepID=UPI00101201CA|nr:MULTISPECIES: iron hydrogenase small subunit [unclassified Fusibacter]MCK8058503.1 iron hydrogenase small subunit [Fusibacter sp. A2]NPE22728.1 hypothetical protein [Fusibacter sp. A1]RXV60288.1 hypothetical protein DWB64_12840 [Fusibacter sp. A1]